MVRKKHNLEANYFEWNQKLLAHFFNNRFKNAFVRLSVDSQLLDDYFSELGGSEGFLQSIKAGPKFLNHVKNPFEKLERLYKLFSSIPDKTYEENEIEYKVIRQGPPYFAYLCFFCYAWNIQSFKDKETKRSFRPTTYYPRLEKVFGDKYFNTNEFKWIYENLWVSLGIWANNKNGENYGKFRIEKLGNHKYVGLPLSQVIFSNSKLPDLADVCYRCDLNPRDADEKSKILHNLTYDDPTTILDEEKFVQSKLGSHISAILKSENKDKEELKNSIIDFISDFLREWDGQPATQIKNKRSQTNTVRIRRGFKITNNSKIEIFYFISDPDEYLPKEFRYVRKIDSEYKEISLSDYFSAEQIARIDSNHSVESEKEISGLKYKLIYSHKRHSVLTMSNVLNSYYITSKYRPRSGDFFFLTSKEAENEIDKLIEIYEKESTIKIQKNPGDFDSEQFSLYYFGSFPVTSETFPIKSESDIDNLSALFEFIGGNKVNELRTTYLDYHLPLLKIKEDVNPEKISWEVSGCKLELLNDSYIDRKDTFQIKVIQGASLIEIKALLNDHDSKHEIFYKKAFYILKQNDISERHEANIKNNWLSDRYGNLVPKKAIAKKPTPYLKGVNLLNSRPIDDSEKFIKNSDILSSSLNEVHHLNDLQFGDSYKFLEALSLKQNYDINHLKLLFQSIFKKNLKDNTWNEIINLSCLGYFEIVENKQSWTKIEPNEICLNLTCNKVENQYLFSIIGCKNINFIKKLISNAMEEGFKVFQHLGNQDSVLPNIIYIASESIESLKIFANKFNIPCSGVLNSYQIADFSCNVEEFWETQIQNKFRTGYGKIYDNISIFDYTSWRFLSRDIFGKNKQERLDRFQSIFNRKYKLIKYKDALLNSGLPRFRLLKGNGENEDYHFHLELDNNRKAWAMNWIINSEVDGEWDCAINQEEDINSFTPLFFNESDSSLIIPSGFLIPKNIKKALFITTSIAPEYLIGTENGLHYSYISGNYKEQRNKNLKVNSIKLKYVNIDLINFILNKINCIAIKREDLIVS